MKATHCQIICYSSDTNTALLMPILCKLIVYLNQSVLLTKVREMALNDSLSPTIRLRGSTENEVAAG